MIQPLQPIGMHPIVTAIALWLLLACGSMTQLPTLNSRQILVTETAIVKKANYRLADAFAKLAALPGYRLESQSIIRDSAGQPTFLTILSRYDATGNSHTLTHSPDGSEIETYVVAGHTYNFDPQYAGWIDRGGATPATLATLGLADSPMQLLFQFDASLREAGRGAIYDRSAIRYELQYSQAELAKAFGPVSGSALPDVSGLIWVDDETGAPLKLEILLYLDQAGQPSQEFRLEVSQIGQIAPIVAPTPIVDPATIVAATATAQNWPVLEAALDYQGELLRFELVPVQVTQLPNAAPFSAEMRLLLRQLPDHLFLPANLEPFLTQLGQQLALSIPQRNTTVPSSSFHLESSDAGQRSLDVLYFFKVNLEDFSHVEVVLSGQGNPAFAPVPVEKRD